MKRTSILLFAVIFILTFASFVTSQDVEIKFSHNFHVQDVEAECLACHALAEESVNAADNLLPDMETCYNCHDEDTECSTCHKDPDNAVEYPRIAAYISKFPHAKHLAQEIDCATCHSGVEKSENILDAHLPSMDTCQSCHQDIEKDSYCIDCHSPKKDLQPLDHKMDWAKAHGVSSQLTQDCKKCHTENQCLDCHQGDNLDRKVHPLNFINNHSLSAKGNKDNCYTCHEELSFCSDCHRQELILPRSHSTAGWSNSKTGGRHAREAKMDLDQCLSCHNDTVSEPICVQCHQAK